MLKVDTDQPVGFLLNVSSNTRIGLAVVTGVSQGKLNTT
ncbi:hypothetical protein GMES_3777 [Paraglaciecola mesophila KMM 241]|uniref:Uncharacterized protein n=1 Tax=Paraglaciecola mesophila KMM 241 TaxID=1128912 RepID=K6ZAQ2_9ALTE|nr:hypothetical protein GMES_3777 [Paraglaciecola mesophila KMM 241]